MLLLETLHQTELCAELAVKRFGIIACDSETAAFRWAFGAERADNHVTARLDSAGDLPNVGNTSLWCRKKMEYGAVMPEVIRHWFQLDFGDIGNDQRTAPRDGPWNLCVRPPPMDTEWTRNAVSMQAGG